MSGIRQRLERFRIYMRQNGMDAFLLPTSDDHGSEYIGGHFKAREYFSGFTGSAGTLAVLKDSAGLWTDGRYFIQAQLQLENTGITLYRMGEPGVPKLEAFLASALPEGSVLGVDGRMLNTGLAKSLISALPGREIRHDGGAIDAVWQNRPPLAATPVRLFEEEYAGEPAREKLAWLRGVLEAQNADMIAVTALDDIAWLLNIRAQDVHANPVALSYAFVSRQDARLFIEKSRLPEHVLEALCALGVRVCPYEAVYAFAKSLSGLRVLVSEESLNYALYLALSEKAELIPLQSPVAERKAQKNAAEIAGMRQAHIEDGVAMVKFLYWLKSRIGEEPISELSAAEKLYAFRRESRNCLGPSFDTICAYGPNAAIVHYSATPESSRTLKPEGLLLVDSGAQYRQGTTDVTRTIALGPLTDTQKRHFTLVLRGMLALMRARFLHGTTCAQLDMLARAPLWAEGLDYRHGTGHGVGCALNVHEGPAAISFRSAGGGHIMQPGMVMSDEPGLYFEGEYGIRTENLLVCVEDTQNEYGSFLRFEPLTLVPIDSDAIAPELMSPDELAQLNAYHARVFDALSPYLEGEARAWLAQATRPIGQ